MFRNCIHIYVDSVWRNAHKREILFHFVNWTDAKIFRLKNVHQIFVVVVVEIKLLLNVDGRGWSAQQKPQTKPVQIKWIDGNGESTLIAFVA